MNKVKLNFACGYNILEDYENYDINPINDKVKYLNLNILPLPFKSNYADEILLKHTIEHLDCNLLDFFKEIIRITKSNGIIIVKTPSENDIIQHTKSSFDIRYFASFLKTKNDKYIDRQVSEIKLYFKYRPLKNLIKFIIKKIKALFISEITWVIRK